MQTFLFKFGSWYLLVAMLLLSILSIKAYRCSMKKIFILFMVISVPAFSDKTYTQLNLFTLKKFQNTIPNLITGRDIRDSSRHRSKSAQFVQYQKAQAEIWMEASKKQSELKEEYADAITDQKKRTWLKDLWNNIVWRLPSWLFPVGAIIICINEIKSSKRIDPIRTTPDFEGKV